MHARFHLDPLNLLATVAYTNITDRQDRQRSDSIRRIVLQTVAQKLVNIPEVILKYKIVTCLLTVAGFYTHNENPVVFELLL